MLGIHSKVRDLVGNLGDGEVIDTYTNHEMPGGPCTMLVCEWPEHETVADRLPNEVKELVHETHAA